MKALDPRRFYKVSVFALPVISSEILKEKIKIDQYVPEDIDNESIAETRYRLQQKLNDAKGVSNMKDILSGDEKERFANWIHTYHSECFRREPLKEYEKYPVFSFEPIMFSFEMPCSLQDVPFSAEYPNEAFRVVWDGVSILVAAKSPIDMVPSGVHDVLERMVEMLNEPGKMNCWIAGLGLHREFTFVPHLKVKGARKWDTLIVSNNCDDIDSNLKRLYLGLYGFVNGLYELNVHLSELHDFTASLDEFQESIFKSISEYIRLSSWHLIAKNRLIADVGKTHVNAFMRYAEFVRSRSLYMRMKNDTLQDLLNDELLEGLRDDFASQFEEPKFDERLFRQTLAKAQNMCEKYSLNRSNILAGAIGGIIVFLLTQVISYLRLLRII